MQNNEHKSIRQVLKDRGYYIALIVCLAAVAISGYLFARTAMRVNETGNPTLSAQEDVNAKLPENPTTPNNTTSADRSTAPKPDEKTAETFDETSTDDTIRAAADAVIVWPLNGAVMNDYSVDALVFNPTMSDWRVHEGIDIAATLGQTVSAAQAGTVSQVYDDDFLGTVVVVDGAEGVQMVYANLTKMPTVTVGDTVTAGQTIGAVGDTALLEVGSEPHLHFAVRKNGAAVDPLTYLP